MKTAVFPGSFDPITKGHYDIIERASKLFDKITVVVMVNPDKMGMFSLEERVQLIESEVSQLENVEVDFFWGLLIDYMRKNNQKVLVKGLRNTIDFNYEYDMESVNNVMNSEIETVFLMSRREVGFISSSIVKQVSSFNGDISKFVSSQVEKAVLDKNTMGRD